MRKLTLVLVSVILLLSVVFISCSEPAYTPTTTAPAYSQPIVEAMLKALTSDDFATYKLYLTPDQANRMTEEIFGYLKDFYLARIGNYQSLQLYDVKVNGDNTTVIYWAKYSKADKVTVTVNFVPVAGAPSVDTLILDSPELRQGGGS